MSLVCPNCFTRFSPAPTLFRCQAKLSRTGEVCAVEVDDRLVTYGLGPGEARVGPVFEVKGNKTISACPDCLVESITRICPECHNHLPGDFDQISSRVIALV